MHQDVDKVVVELIMHIVGGYCESPYALLLKQVLEWNPILVEET